MTMRELLQALLAVEGDLDTPIVVYGDGPAINVYLDLDGVVIDAEPPRGAGQPKGRA